MSQDVPHREAAVQVAVVVRPLIDREVAEGNTNCVSVDVGQRQVLLGNENFTYDHVFNGDVNQQTIYEDCVQNLVDGCFRGYNATLIAYGQTGSGKTHTMGTGYFKIAQLNHDRLGIVPRALHHVFDRIERERQTAEFKVEVQFLELYKEKLEDLLDETRHSEQAKRKQIRILNDKCGVKLSGVTSHTVESVSEALKFLEVGTLSRTTASTQMNTQSSRSHAIFTLIINQTLFATGIQKVKRLAAKFHFVDLAGSERQKRTNAEGIRFQEARAINTSLLYLGKVISSLSGEEKSKIGNGHVSYRDSKLTRLLQDSLGGNSQTVVIACISPSDGDSSESLNTLKYANWARNIKNKVIVIPENLPRIKERTYCSNCEAKERLKVNAATSPIRFPFPYEDSHSPTLDEHPPILDKHSLNDQPFRAENSPVNDENRTPPRLEESSVVIYTGHSSNMDLTSTPKTERAKPRVCLSQLNLSVPVGLELVTPKGENPLIKIFRGEFNSSLPEEQAVHAYSSDPARSKELLVWTDEDEQQANMRFIVRDDNGSKGFCNTSPASPYQGCPSNDNSNPELNEVEKILKYSSTGERIMILVQFVGKQKLWIDHEVVLQLKPVHFYEDFWCKIWIFKRGRRANFMKHRSFKIEHLPALEKLRDRIERYREERRLSSKKTKIPNSVRKLTDVGKDPKQPKICYIFGQEDGQEERLNHRHSQPCPFLSHRISK